MRTVDRQHIEKRVTCKDCPNKYCLDCHPIGCDKCGSKEFYTTHGNNPFNDRDLDTIHNSIGSDFAYQPIFQQEGEGVRISDGSIRPGQIISNNGVGWVASTGDGGGASLTQATDQQQYQRLENAFGTTYATATTGLAQTIEEPSPRAIPNSVEDEARAELINDLLRRERGERIEQRSRSRRREF